MLIFTLRYKMAVILARIVMPRSRSSSLESITRSATTSFKRKAPLCRSMASTSVVLPWSTCAMMAMLRIDEFKGVLMTFLMHEQTETKLGHQLCPALARQASPPGTWAGGPVGESSSRVEGQVLHTIFAE